MALTLFFSYLASAQEAKMPEMPRSDDFRTEEVHFKSQGKDIFGMAFTPVGANASAKMPAVIMSHGFCGDPVLYYELIERLAGEGFICYFLDFSGGSHRMRSEGEFQDMSILTEQKNLEDAIRMVRGWKNVDRERIFLVGESQGGIVSAMAAAAKPAWVKAMALMYPAFSIPDMTKSVYASKDEVPQTVDFLGQNVGRCYYVDAMGLDIWKIVASFSRNVLIVHGDKDVLVPIEYSYKALEYFPHAELKVNSGAPHGFFFNEYSHRNVDWIDEFFRKEAGVKAVAKVTDGAVSLNGQWRLSYWKQDAKGAVRTPDELAAVDAETIDATVPGNVEIDLERAGIIPDPMIGANVNGLRKYEGYQWCYSRTFGSPKLEEGQKCELYFGGIDCYSEIWLNGKHLASTANSLIEHRFDITDLLADGDNELKVIIRSAVIEAQGNLLGTISMGDFAAEESITSRKAPHTYGWDIMPRLVSAGLWRDVRLDILEPTRIVDINWMSPVINPADRSAWIRADLQLSIPFEKYDKATASFRMERNGKVIHESTRPILSHAMRTIFEVKDVDYWWPKGSGEPALYDATVTILDTDGKTVLAKDTKKVGIRTVQLDRTEINNPPAEPGRFRFIINGEPIFIRGTNWVPLDALHSRDHEWVGKTLDMVADLNCNMVRCWGGNVYEDHEFYDRCDREGIMVWQDFTMGCAFYPQREDFNKAIEEEVISVVTKLRNHPCIALWSGNNENDQSLRSALQGHNPNPNMDVVSRQTIARVIFEFDPTRPYLPSSPYFSQATYDAGGSFDLLPEDHIWGPRGYYKDDFYKNPKCQFVSEIGYHGCPNKSSLERMMPEGQVYPWEAGSDHRWNDAWLTKATRRYEGWGYTPDRNNLMINQCLALFGECPSRLEDFITASQFVQAEAMKTFVEKWRGNKFDDRWGIIWWNVRDGWPIISDAVTDYWCSKKLAYHYIKNAQYDVCVMMLDKEDGCNPLVAVNDTRSEVSGKVTVSDLESGKVIYSGEFTVPANGKTDIASLSLEGLTQGVLVIDYESGSVRRRNHFTYGEPPYDLGKFKGWIRSTGIYDSECLDYSDK